MTDTRASHQPHPALLTAVMPQRPVAPSCGLMTLLISACLAVILALSPACSAAGTPVTSDDHRLPNAEAAITEFLTARVGYEADEVRVELEGASARLLDCTNAAPFLPRDDTPLWGRITVAVACDDASTPRYLQVRVIALGSYVSAATTVQPGTLIEPWMLELSHGDLGELPVRTLRFPGDAVGQEARQRLSEGAPVRAHQLRPPVLVTRGQTVAIEAQGRGFSINREGEALDSGGHGESVRVRISRQQTLTATVIGSGRVSVSE